MAQGLDRARHRAAARRRDPRRGGLEGLLAGLQDVGQLDRAGQYGLLTPTLFLPLAAAVLGVLVAGQEWRHRLAVPTYLAAPGRTRVLLAKLAVAAGVATATGLAATGSAAVLCTVVLDARTALLVPFADGLLSILGTALASGLLATGGVALGTFVRSQAGVVGVAAVVLLVLAPLTQVLLPELAAVLPNGAALSLGVQERADDAYLPQLAGGAVLVAEMAVLAVLAARALRRADLA